MEKDRKSSNPVSQGSKISTSFDLENLETTQSTQEKNQSLSNPCPYCGKEVKENAVRCIHCNRLIKFYEHCGAPFEDQPLPPPPPCPTLRKPPAPASHQDSPAPAVPPKIKRITHIHIGLGIVVIVIIIALVFASGVMSKSSNHVVPPTIPMNMAKNGSSQQNISSKMPLYSDSPPINGKGNPKYDAQDVIGETKDTSYIGHYWIEKYNEDADTYTVAKVTKLVSENIGSFPNRVYSLGNEREHLSRADAEFRYPNRLGKILGYADTNCGISHLVLPSTATMNPISIRGYGNQPYYRVELSKGLYILTLDTPNKQFISFSVLDNNGQDLFEPDSHYYGENTITSPISIFRSGTYFLKIESNDEWSLNIRQLIQQDLHSVPYSITGSGVRASDPFILEPGIYKFEITNKDKTVLSNEISLIGAYGTMPGYSTLLIESNPGIYKKDITINCGGTFILNMDTKGDWIVKLTRS